MFCCRSFQRTKGRFAICDRLLPSLVCVWTRTPHKLFPMRVDSVPLVKSAKRFGTAWFKSDKISQKGFSGGRHTISFHHLFVHRLARQQFGLRLARIAKPRTTLFAAKRLVRQQVNLRHARVSQRCFERCSLCHVSCPRLPSCHLRHNTSRHDRPRLVHVATGGAQDQRLPLRCEP